ncbi:hypothetical protein YC2023_115469 [Brassica napus]
MATYLPDRFHCENRHFEVVRCSNMYKITDHPFLIRFISLTIIDEIITDAPEINIQSKLDCSTISK